MVHAEALEHIRYSTWASRKLMDAARALPARDLHKPQGVSHNSIAQTLGHIFLADRIWCSRVVDTSLPEFAMPASELSEALWNRAEDEWPQIQQKWEDWAANIDDAGLARAITFVSRIDGGKQHTMTARQILKHVVNHATLHRGQVVAMLRQAGAKPPATDLLFYYWEHE